MRPPIRRLADRWRGSSSARTGSTTCSQPATITARSRSSFRWMTSTRCSGITLCWVRSAKSSPLTDSDGHFLTTLRYPQPALATFDDSARVDVRMPEGAVRNNCARLSRCQNHPRRSSGPDLLRRGVRSAHVASRRGASRRPSALLDQLAIRGALFALVGVVLSLLLGAGFRAPSGVWRCPRARWKRATSIARCRSQVRRKCAARPRVRHHGPRHRRPGAA